VNLYITSASERDNAIKKLGYVVEGMKCYVLPFPISDQVRAQGVFFVELVLISLSGSWLLWTAVASSNSDEKESEGRYGDGSSMTMGRLEEF